MFLICQQKTQINQTTQTNQTNQTNQTVEETSSGILTQSGDTNQNLWVRVAASNIVYNTVNEGAAGRNTLVTTYNWKITDGGQV